MADILMDTDMFQYNESLKRNSIFLSEYNEILDAYTVMGIGTLTAAEFRSLVMDPAGFVFDKLTNGQDVVLGGLKVNKAKAIEIIEKPDGYQALADLVAHYKNIKSNFIHYLSMIDVVAGEVVLSQATLDQQLAGAKIWAKTNKEKAAFEFAQGVIALAETKFGAGPKPDLNSFVSTIITRKETVFSNGNYQYAINAREIRNFQGTY